MPCEHFSGGRYPLCMAVQGLMTPSLSDMGTYCAGDHSSQCPLHQQYAARGAKVPLEAAAVLMEAAATEQERRGPLRKSARGAEERAAAEPLPPRRAPK
jgi:hypothetical protein